MKKVHLAVRSASREHVQSLIREALEPGFESMAQGLFRSEIESMLDHALQAELATHLGRATYERTGQGPWRNGSKTVTLPSPLGVLSVNKPVLVIPIVLYNGLGEWKVLDLSESFPGLPPALLPFLPSFRFLLMDLVREPLEPLRERFGNRSVRLALELMRAIFSPEEVRALMERLTPEDGPLDRDLALRFLRVVLRYIFKRSDTTVREALALNLHPELREQTMTMEEEVLLRGEQRGLAKGVAKGIEQGLRQNALENARKMLDRGCAWPFITDVTGIRPEDLAG